MTIDNVKVTAIGLDDFTEQEAKRYVDYVRSNVKIENTPLAEIVVKMCPDGKVDVDYLFKGDPFHRLRRITGYLTSDLRSWNDSKQSEERERVKHTGLRINYNVDSMLSTEKISIGVKKELKIKKDSRAF